MRHQVLACHDNNIVYPYPNEYNAVRVMFIVYALVVLASFEPVLNKIGIYSVVLQSW